MTDQVTLKAWGNSSGIRIPKQILELFNMKNEDVLQLETTEDAIVIRKAFRHKTFEERLSEYNGEISVAAYDWGEPKGREML